MRMERFQPVLAGTVSGLKKAAPQTQFSATSPYDKHARDTVSIATQKKSPRPANQGTFFKKFLIGMLALSPSNLAIPGVPFFAPTTLKAEDPPQEATLPVVSDKSASKYVSPETEIQQLLTRSKEFGKLSAGDCQDLLDTFPTKKALPLLQQYNNDAFVKNYFDLLVKLYDRAASEPKNEDAQMLKEDVSERFWDILLDEGTLPNPEADYYGYGPRQEIPSKFREAAVKQMIAMEGKSFQISKLHLKKLMDQRDDALSSILMAMPETEQVAMAKMLFRNHSDSFKFSQKFTTLESRNSNTFFRLMPSEMLKKVLAGSKVEFEELLDLHLADFREETLKEQSYSVGSNSVELLSNKVLAAAPAIPFKPQWRALARQMQDQIPRTPQLTKLRELLIKRLGQLAVLEMKKDSGVEKPELYPFLMDLLQKDPNGNWMDVEPVLLNALAGEAMVNHRPENPRILSVSHWRKDDPYEIKTDEALVKPLEDKLISVLKTLPADQSDVNDKILYDKAKNTAHALMYEPFHRPAAFKAWQKPVWDEIMRGDPETQIERLQKFENQNRRFSSSEGRVSALKDNLPNLRKLMNTAADLMLETDPARIDLGSRLMKRTSDAYPWFDSTRFPQDAELRRAFTRLHKHFQTAEIKDEAVLQSFLDTFPIYLHWMDYDAAALTDVTRSLNTQIAMAHATRQQAKDPSDSVLAQKRQTLLMAGMEDYINRMKLTKLSMAERVPQIEAMFRQIETKVLPGANQFDLFEQANKLLTQVRELPVEDTPEAQPSKVFMEKYAIPVFFKAILREAKGMPQKEQDSFLRNVIGGLNTFLIFTNLSHKNLHIQDMTFKVLGEEAYNAKDPRISEKVGEVIDTLLNGSYGQFAMGRTALHWNTPMFLRFVESTREGLDATLEQTRKTLTSGREDQQLQAMEILNHYSGFLRQIRDHIAEPNQPHDLSPERIAKIESTVREQEALIGRLVLDKLKAASITVKPGNGPNDISRTIEDGTMRATLSTLGTTLRFQPALTGDAVAAISERLADPANRNIVLRGHLYRALGEIPVDGKTELPVLHLLKEGILSEKSGVVAEGIGEALRMLWMKELAGPGNRPEQFFPYPSSQLQSHGKVMEQRLAKLTDTLDQMSKRDRRTDTPPYREEPAYPVQNTVYWFYNLLEQNFLPLLKERFDFTKIRDESTGKVDEKFRDAYYNAVINPSCAMGAFAAETLKLTRDMPPAEKPGNNNGNIYYGNSSVVRYHLDDLTNRITNQLEKNIWLEFHFSISDVAASLVRVYRENNDDPSANTYEKKITWLRGRLFEHDLNKPDQGYPLFKIYDENCHIHYIDKLLEKGRLRSADVEKCRSIQHRLRGPEGMTDSERRYIRDLDEDLYSKVYHETMEELYCQFMTRMYQHSVNWGNRGWKDAKDVLMKDLKLENKIYKDKHIKQLSELE